MKNKKRLCLLMALVVMGAGVSVYAQSQADDIVAESAQQEQVKDNKDVLEKAQEAIDVKDYQSAIVYLTGYISSKPKKYEAYKLRAEAFYALRQYKLAEMDFQAAIDIKKDSDKFATGAKVLGAVILGADKQEQYQNPELGNLYAGLMYAQKAMNLPAYEISYQNAVKYNSHIYLPQPKKEDIAKINYPQKYGKSLNPQGVDKIIFGTIDDIESGNYLEGSYKAQNIITNYPKYYLGYYLLGVCFNGLDKQKEAIDAFNNAIKLNPYDFESMASLGQIYYENAQITFSEADRKKSIDYFANAIKYNPNCHLYHYYIGLNQLQAAAYDSAISSFNKAITFKSDDYNSSYYKLIAQYMNGKYSDVVEGCTNLLYRHVSNSNSVLYLRALAHNKLNNSAFAIADIETIQNNMGDIYNSDIKSLSDKEKTLESYLYYLKAQILSSKGFGVKADLAKAFQNPVISTLNKGGNISVSALQLKSSDVQNQYDYIRTTFDNLNVSFEYMNPGYKFVQLKPSATPTSHIAEENMQTPVLSLKPAAEPQDIISNENRTSIAEMLALNALATQHAESVKPEVKDIETSIQANSSEKESVSSEEEIIVLDSDTILFKAPVQQKTESFEIKYEKDIPTIAKGSEQVIEPVITEKIEEKVVQSVNEENNIAKVQEELNDKIQKTQQENILEKTAQAQETAPESKSKQTNMNLKGFGSETKTMPEINEDDEVIVFVPEEKSIMKDIEQSLQAQTSSINSEKPITDDFTVIKKNVEPEIVAETKEDVALIEPEDVKIPAKLLAKKEPMPVTEVVLQSDDSESQIAESAPIAPEGILTEEPVLKKEKNNKKVKAEVELKDFLTADNNQIAEKDVKVKKEVNELAEFLNPSEEVTVSEQEVKKVKKEKRSLFKRSKKIVPAEPVVEVEEPLVPDTAVPEVSEEKPVNNEQQPTVIEQKPKKSWFSIFKRNKKTKITEPDKQEEILAPAPSLEESEKPVSVYEFDENKFEQILKGEEVKTEKKSRKLKKKSKKVETEQE